MHLPRAPSPGAATTTPIFQWSGGYVGFITAGWFFSADGRYLGWRDDSGLVWRADGGALGQLVDNNYILCNLLRSSPIRRTPPVPPVPPTPPSAPGARLPRPPKPGWTDPLASWPRRPLRQELAGEWRLDGARLSLLDSGAFVWSNPAGAAVTGSWELAGEFIILRDSEGAAAPQQASYRIIEFSGAALTLRWLAQRRTLPFTLRRHEE